MKSHKKYAGFTLTELMVTILISSLLVLIIGVVMLDTQRGWLDSYAKVHGGAADDAAMVKAAFDRVARKASRSIYQLSAPDNLKVYYYADWETSTNLDRSARFYLSSANPSEMYVEHTNLTTNTVTATVLLASTVSGLEFLPVDGGFTMNVLLDDGREQTTVVSTAIFHNE